MVSVLSACSKAAKFRTKIPACPAREIPATRVMGMAMPRAHGHEITMTVTDRIMAVSTDRPDKRQTHPVPRESSTTRGTNQRRIRSVFASRGVFFPRAFSIMSIICPRVDPSPMPSAVALNVPCSTRVPLRIRFPALICTGRASPVREDSSTVPEPSSIRPSAGIISFSSAIKTSPRWRAPTAT